jgi:hypothetical protein
MRALKFDVFLRVLLLSILRIDPHGKTMISDLVSQRVSGREFSMQVFSNEREPSLV